MSIKNKTQKELKEEYVRCSLGLGFFLAANTFNISPTIARVQISGYTQRVSKKTGNLNDDYVYSVSFDRHTFGKLNLAGIEPYEAMDNFDSEIEISKTFQMNTIQPFG